MPPGQPREVSLDVANRDHPAIQGASRNTVRRTVFCVFDGDRSFASHHTKSCRARRLVFALAQRSNAGPLGSVNRKAIPSLRPRARRISWTPTALGFKVGTVIGALAGRIALRSHSTDTRPKTRSSGARLGRFRSLYPCGITLGPDRRSADGRPHVADHRHRRAAEEEEKVESGQLRALAQDGSSRTLRDLTHDASHRQSAARPPRIVALR